MILNHIILAMLWIAYCVLHSVLASDGLKKRLKQSMHNYKWYRLWYTLFSFIFLVALIWYEIRMQTITLFPSYIIIQIAGIVLSFSGLVLMIVCIYRYFMNLSGLRSLIIENFSNVLQIKGVHRYVRHPLYLGTFAFIWGLFLLLPCLSLLISNTIITVYTLIGIGFEEKKLIAEFGESYIKYQADVPKLLPSFRLKREPGSSSS